MPNKFRKQEEDEEYQPTLEEVKYAQWWEANNQKNKKEEIN